ncbi:asparagine synthetase B family protein [Tumebacillus flagellatus]|uniref:asparagine synthase (glutamine-hydrolyzing) n=1 Tax=Tumebacillus flagellatus TaxID=1157490 RepID=A0A074M8L0_9BACL|nr:asparagine synthase-related protein [Tumebacillus flagellatus]KEO82322.1 hypothetical protein EL26_16215 [Tumebacillus flagellatus]
MRGFAGVLDWKREAAESFTCQDAAVNAQREVTAAAEGGLYNRNEIQNELSNAGYRFAKNGTLADLFLAAYLHWGDGFVERFAGAFAFAIWDAREQRMILGRDQLGMKNLYYSDRGSVIPFATELKQVLAHPAVSRTVTGEGLAELFLKGPYFSPGNAVFSDVREVKPGHLVICTTAGTKNICYWNLQSLPHEDSLEQTVSTLDKLLNAHVSEWKELPTPPTLILSGGLDSSGLMGMMHRSFGQAHPEWKSFSGNTAESYEAEDTEDLDFVWVRRMAEHFGVTNEEVLYDFAAAWERNDLPRHLHALPTQAKFEAMLHQIYSVIKPQNPCVVIGEGADELFASTHHFYSERRVGDASQPWLPEQPAIYASPDVLRSIRAEEYAREQGAALFREVSLLPGDDEPNVRMRQLTYLMIKEYLPYLLRRNGLITDDVGVRLQMPFVDHRLAQYAWNIPWEMKNYRNQPKGVLRQVFRSYLPDAVIDRKKSNQPVVFKSPYAQKLRQAAERFLQDRNAPLYDLVDRGQIRKTLDEGVIERDKLMRWRLDYYLQIDHWMREYGVEVKI